MSRHVLEVASGRFVDYDDPSIADIQLEDIAHALSLTCRYGGHSERFYSVAEHALLVSRLLQRTNMEHLALAGLHHDDAEAYLGDIPTPLKRMFGDLYGILESRFESVISLIVGVPVDEFHAAAIQWADAVALRLEAYWLKPSGGYAPEWDEAWADWGLRVPPTSLVRGWEPGLTPREAEAGFLAEHGFLSGG